MIFEYIRKNFQLIETVRNFSHSVVVVKVNQLFYVSLRNYIFFKRYLGCSQSFTWQSKLRRHTFVRKARTFLYIISWHKRYLLDVKNATKGNYSNLISTCLREFFYLGIHDFRKEAIIHSSIYNTWTSHDYLEIFFISLGISLIYFYQKWP